MRGLERLITLVFALFFGFIAFNNISDYETNFHLIQSVLSMEHIDNPQVEWRALFRPSLHHFIYISLIITEALISLTLFTSLLLKNLPLAIYALTLGALLFFMPFVLIAGEWFYLWATPYEPLQSKALLLSFLLTASAIYLKTNTNSQK